MASLEVLEYETDKTRLLVRSERNIESNIHKRHDDVTNLVLLLALRKLVGRSMASLEVQEDKTDATLLVRK